MTVPILPFSLPGCTIDQVRSVDTNLLVEAYTNTQTATCPQCHKPSARIHSRYRRMMRDLPVSEWHVSVLLQVRRFFCDQSDCLQQTFAERLPELVPFRGLRTVRFTRRLQAIAFATSGEAGARLAAGSQLATSPDTLLRIMPATEACAVAMPRVLGVDDFALQKGRVYGTLLVDLERHKPIDILPDRTAETLANWLRDHPGVEVIARDRSTEYARGASTGAPAAIQAADRWHLLKNHREAIERLLNRVPASLTKMPVPSLSEEVSSAVMSMHASPLRRPSVREQAVRQAVRDRRITRYEDVQTLLRQGIPQVQIATRLGLARATARTFAEAAVFPERAASPRQPRRLEPYVAYLQQRVNEGCTNASQLWRELHAQGYIGTRKQIARWMQHKRSEPAATAPRKYDLQATDGTLLTNGTAIRETQPSLAAPRRLVWVMLRQPDKLTHEESTTLARIQQHPEVARAWELAQEFVILVRQRKPEAFDSWLTACATSGSAELQSFAKGLEQEYASIRAALSEPWSSGQVEGQVTRLKSIKRQMYGRANVDLLRQRVLAAT